MEMMAVSLWFGAVSGLGEAFLVFVCDIDPVNTLGHGWPILWIAPLFNMLFFGSVALLALMINVVIPRAVVKRAFLWLIFGLAILDWLVCLLYMRIGTLAICSLAFGIATFVFPMGRRFKWAVVAFCRNHLPLLALTIAVVFVVSEMAPRVVERQAIARLPAASPDQPNVIVLVIDTLRADRLSCHGYIRNTSPNIDAFAAQGVLFENAYAGSAWTPPSHASLVTGEPVHVHKADLAPLGPSLPTIGENMSGRGYATAVFSANTTYFSRRRGYARGFHHFEDQFYGLFIDFTRCVYGRTLVKALSFNWTADGTEWKRRRAPSINAACVDWLNRNRNHQTLAILNYMDVHAPYETPAEHVQRFSKSTQSLEVAEDKVPAEIKPLSDAYDEGIAYADECFGRLLTDLNASGIDKNTIIVVTSDHGEMLGEHGLMQHANALYREVTHVPLIIRWPGHIPAGCRIDTPVSNADIGATIVDLVGGKEGGPFAGRSLAKRWQDPSSALSWPPVLIELTHKPWYPSPAPTHYGSMKSLVTEQFQLIMNQGRPPELYDIKIDPLEMQNLAGRREYQETLAELGSQLEKLSPGWW
jgi:arylsulfatase A-like enzyme